MSEETPKQRLLKFIESKNLSVRKFETAADLGNAFVDGVGKSIRQSSVNKIKAAFPDFDEKWIISGVTQGSDSEYKMLYEELRQAVCDYFNSRDALQRLATPLDKPAETLQNSSDEEEGTTAFAPIPKTTRKGKSEKK